MSDDNFISPVLKIEIFILRTFFTAQFFIMILVFTATMNVKTEAGGNSPNIINSSTSFIYLKQWQITKDTSPTKPLPNYPDSQWKRVDLLSDESQYSEANWILKTTIFVGDSLSEKDVFGLFPFAFITAYEIYWDGEIIAQNGVRGLNKEEEKAGLFTFNVVLPHRIITPGNHTIMMRISSYHNYSPLTFLNGEVVVGNYDFVKKAMFKKGYLAFFISGILLIAFLLNLFLFFTRHRKTEHLLFSLFCLFVILDFLISQAPQIIDFSTTWLHFEYYFYQTNSVLFTILFPVFLIYTFGLPKRLVTIILAVVAVIYLLFTDYQNVFSVLSITVLILGSVISIWTLILKREGSIVIFIGLILSWVAYYFNFAFEGLATVMVICSSFLIAQQFATKEKAEKEAQLKSTRLEIELLKKNINPHFVLNTLTSIIVWLRKDSDSAIKLIESLAEEFRIINQVSALKQIPVKQEIELCEAHLKIMSYRKGADFKMETHNIVEHESIPPMIFHTLVENGLTHGYETKTSGIFTLIRTRETDYTQFILRNDGDFNSDDGNKSSGFGIRYISSRLQESYPERWKFSSNKIAGGWETIIQIRDK